MGPMNHNVALYAYGGFAYQIYVINEVLSTSHAEAEGLLDL